MGFRPGLVAFLVTLAFTAPAAAFCRLYTQSPSSSDDARAGCVEAGIPLAWQQRCISYTLVPSDELELSLEDVRAAIDRSFGTWMAVECGDSAARLPITFGQTEELGACDVAEYNRYGPNANTIAFVSDWESRGSDYLPEAYGLTLVWHNPENGAILDADIQINLSREPIAICGEQCAGAYVDLENVLTHEVGHFLGLAHSPDPDAAMFAEARVAEVRKRELWPDDIDGACAIYGDREQLSCEEAAFSPRRGFTPACSQPAESGGCAMRAGVSARGTLAAAGLGLLALALVARRRG